MSTARLETFSDGVFAIAATLLILDVKLPDGKDVAHGYLAAWPSYGAFAISFVTIGIMWINHHEIFRHIVRADRTFLVINVVFLMVISFIPFPTRVLAEHMRHDAQAAAFAYGLTNVAMATMYSLLWFYALRGRRLIAEDADERALTGISRAFLPGIPVYTLATLSALISSWLAIGIFAGLIAFYALESSLFGRSG